VKVRPGLLPFALLGATICILVVIGSVSGQSPELTTTGQPSYKIGVIDLDAVFKDYDRQRDEYARLKEERDRRQAQIDDLSAQITKVESDYRASKDSLPDEERFAMEEKISADFAKYQAEFKRFQGDIDRMEKRMIERLFKDIHESVEEIGQAENYHMIFESGAKRPSGLLYSSPTLDLTGRVVDYLNAKYAEAKSNGVEDESSEPSAAE